MWVDTAPEDRQAGLHKIMKLLEGLGRTQIGEVLYEHIGQMLKEQERIRGDSERALSGMLRIVLDAFSLHLPEESRLYAEIKLLQLRLMPPFNPGEIMVLHEFAERCADHIAELEELPVSVLEQALAPVLSSFGLPKGEAAAATSLSQYRRKDDEVPASQDDSYLERWHSDVSQVDVDAVAGRVEGAVSAQPALSSDELSESISRSEEFGAWLEIQLANLRKADQLESFDEKKNTVIHELEKVLNAHRQLSGHFGRLIQTLDVMQHDSERLNEELNRVTMLSLTDDLTGLPNRRAFVQRLQDEVSRVQRYGQPLAVAIMDLDQFKAINDEYGHSLGDSVLNTYARDVLTVFRQHDLVARYGGEEFAVILPNTEGEGALRALQKAQAVASRHSIRSNEKELSLPTFSAGLAVYHAGESTDALMKRADSALYRAKDAGRNCIELA